MRLIDADELLKPVGSYNPIKYTYEYGEVVTVEDIKQMPTVDAEPIRHGHWVYGQCSVCGEYPLTRVKYRGEEIWNIQNKYKYCPFCGAKMDEVKE